MTEDKGTGKIGGLTYFYREDMMKIVEAWLGEVSRLVCLLHGILVKRQGMAVPKLRGAGGLH